MSFPFIGQKHGERKKAEEFPSTWISFLGNTGVVSSTRSSASDVKPTWLLAA